MIKKKATSTNSQSKTTQTGHKRRTPTTPPGGFRGNRQRYPNGGKIK